LVDAGGGGGNGSGATELDAAAPDDVVGGDDVDVDDAIARGVEFAAERPTSVVTAAVSEEGEPGTDDDDVRESDDPPQAAVPRPISVITTAMFRCTASVFPFPSATNRGPHPPRAARIAQPEGSQ
jgi:hypothetical protein